MAGMTMEELAGKISEIVDKSVAPLKAELEAAKTAGQDTSKIEAAVKAAIEAGEKKKSAAANEWEALIENARVEKDGGVKIDAAGMVGKIAASAALSLKETGAKNINDRSVVLDFAKKMFPNDKALHGIMQKDMEASIPSAGGYGIPQILLPNYVEYLYANTLLEKLGVTKVPMVNGNFRMARIDSTTSFSWGGETPSGNATQPVLGDIVLNAKKGTAVVPISNTLLRQNAIGLDAMISKDLRRIATIALDNAMLHGLGNSYQPLGLENVSGIQTSGSSGSNTALTVQFPIDMLALLEQANVPMENPAWLMNPVAKGWLMGKAFSSGPFAWAAEMANGKTLNGIPFYSSATVKNSGSAPTWANIWLADWSELVWGVSYDMALNISRDGSYVNSAGATIPAFQRDETLIRLVTECDFNVKHPVSFVEAFVSKGS